MPHGRRPTRTRVSRHLLPGLLVVLAGTSAALGQQSQNLVYTAVAPCRIVDTRLAVDGILQVGQQREFHVVGTNDFGAQGGANGGCGIPGYEGGPRVTAVMLNFVAAQAEGNGNLRAWATGLPPNASILNYGVQGTNLANGVAVPIDQDGVEGDDLQVLASINRTHVVIDVLGYFSPLTLSDGPGSGIDADTVDGLHASAFAAASHAHPGEAITSGTVADAVIAASIARDSEILPTVLANDGSGSNLDADRLDGLSSLAFQRRLARYAIVAANGTGDYEDPAAAIADLATWCGVPSGNNRCTIHVMPGVYVVSTAVVLPASVDLEGNGSTISVIWRSGTGGPDPEPTLVLEGGGGVRDIAIVANGGQNAVAIQAQGDGRTLREVYASAQGGSASNTAIRVTAGSHTLIDVFAVTFGASPLMRAVDLVGGSLTARDSTLQPQGSTTASECIGLLGGSTFELVGSRIFASCDVAVGVRTSGPNASHTMRGGRIRVVGTTTAIGFDVGTGHSATLFDADVSSVQANAGSTALGISNAGGASRQVQIHRSYVNGGTNGLRSSGGSTTRVQHSVLWGVNTTNAASLEGGDALYVGASQLVSRAVVASGIATRVCIGSYDFQMNPLPDDCEP